MNQLKTKSRQKEITLFWEERIGPTASKKVLAIVKIVWGRVGEKKTSLPPNGSNRYAGEFFFMVGAILLLEITSLLPRVKGVENAL